MAKIKRMLGRQLIIAIRNIVCEMEKNRSIRECGESRAHDDSLLNTLIILGPTSSMSISSNRGLRTSF